MKLKCCLFFATFFLFLSNGKAQQVFQKTHNGIDDDYCFAVADCADKGFALTGYTASYGAGANDCFITKTDSLGNIIWSKTYGSNHDDEAYAIKQTTDGGFIMAGYSKNLTATNYLAYLIKTNAVGDTLWTKNYGGLKNDYANCVQQTADGGFVLAGYTTSFVSDTNSGNIFLVKTDANGNPTWTKSFGGITGITDAYSIQQTTDKGYIITGYTNAFGEANGDVFLLKTDSAGTTSWLKTYGSNGTDWGNSVKQTNDGGYIIAGSASFDTTNLINVYLIKTNANGDTLWTKTYGGTGYDFGQSIEIMDTGFVVVGYTNGCSANNYDALYMKTDTLGNIIWYKISGISPDDEANFVSKSNYNSCIIGGITYNQDNYDVYLLSIDSIGNSCLSSNCTFETNKAATRQLTQSIITYTCSNTYSYTSTQINTGFTASNDICAGNFVEIHKSNEFVTLYPNPTNGMFVVSSNDEGNTSIQIKSTLGEVVYSAQNASKKIDVSYLENGTYFVQIQSTTNRYIQKIVITK